MKLLKVLVFGSVILGVTASAPAPPLRLWVSDFSPTEPTWLASPWSDAFEPWGESSVLPPVAASLQTPMPKPIESKPPSSGVVRSLPTAAQLVLIASLDFVEWAAADSPEALDAALIALQQIGAYLGSCDWVGTDPMLPTWDTALFGAQAAIFAPSPFFYLPESTESPPLTFDLPEFSFDDKDFAPPVLAIDTTWLPPSGNGSFVVGNSAGITAAPSGGFDQLMRWAAVAFIAAVLFFPWLCSRSARRVSDVSEAMSSDKSPTKKPTNRVLDQFSKSIAKIPSH